MTTQRYAIRDTYGHWILCDWCHKHPAEHAIGPHGSMDLLCDDCNVARLDPDGAIIDGIER